MTSTDRGEDTKRLASKALSKGYQLTENSIKILLERKNPDELLDRLLSWIKSSRPGTILVEPGVVMDFLRTIEEKKPRGEQVAETASFRVKSTSYSDVWIEGSTEEFRLYFTVRYQRIREIFERRGISVYSPSELRDQGLKEAYIIGMVSEVRPVKNGYSVLVEDPKGVWRIFVPKGDRNLEERVEELLPDMVVMMRVRVRASVLVAQDILLPDIPPAPQRKLSGPDINVCIISDIHVGSSRFNEELFNDFLEWLSSDEEEASKTGFLVVNGDLVDGVYIYPGQEDELALPSLNKQFEKASELLKKIPKRVTVIYAPGNHEPVRKALPQPPVQHRYRELLGQHDGLVFVGNPAWISFDGVDFLVFHGQTLDDIIQSGSRFSYSTIHHDAAALLEFVLRTRHLAPTYGVVTPLLPLRDDPLMISEVPAVFATGHIHVAAQSVYRGVYLVNTGTWQEQTKFQASLGLEPTVGTAAIFNLRSMRLSIKKFG